jgi:feruloyl esterase
MRFGALERWVEQGVAPEQLVASQVDAQGAVDRTRPLCWYPRIAKHDGSGSIDDANNFTCEKRNGDPDED